MNLQRIGDLFNVEKGSLQSTKSTEGKYTFITAAEDWKTHNAYTHNCEALIFAAAASGSLGRTHYFNGKFISSDLCFILTPKDTKKYPIDLKFYHFVLNSIKDEIVKQTKTGTSKESINITNFSNYLIPYFNVTLQHHWIDKLTVVRDSRNNLTGEFNFQLSNIQLLRQAILQEAVQGKLVPQNPKDEPASELLKRIKAEKAKLIHAGFLKKSKELLLVSKSEEPFILPNSWIWSRWGDIGANENYAFKRGPFGSDLKKEFFTSTGYKVYEQRNAIYNNATLGDYFISAEKYKELEAFKVKAGDFIISCSGATLGRLGIIPDNFREGIINQALLKVSTNKKAVCKDYFVILFRSPYFQSKILDNSKGSAIPNMVGLEILKNIPFPLPPFEEQKRIVAKVQQLMLLCDELEAQVQQSKADAEKLLQAVLREAFEGKKTYNSEDAPLSMAAEP